MERKKRRYLATVSKYYYSVVLVILHSISSTSITVLLNVHKLLFQHLIRFSGEYVCVISTRTTQDLLTCESVFTLLQIFLFACDIAYGHMFLNVFLPYSTTQMMFPLTLLIPHDYIINLPLYTTSLFALKLQGNFVDSLLNALSCLRFFRYHYNIENMTTK
jgi:hypothetical protein